MSCPAPLDAAVLTDYWLGELAGAEEGALEEHLFACDACGSRLRELAALLDGVRRLAGEGLLRLVVTPGFVQRAAGRGRRVREYALAPGASVQCTVAADDDLLISRLAADLRGAARIDASLRDAAGTEWLRLVDLPVREGATEVLYQESMAFAKAAASQTMVVCLLGIDADGRETVLGDYTFHHTRTLPGPGLLLGDPGPPGR